MTMKLFCCTLVMTALSVSSASAELKIQTFDAAPEFEEPEPRVLPVPNGGWGVQQDGLENVDEGAGILLTPFWNEGGGGSSGSNGWLTTVGFETADDNLGPLGGNAEKLNFGAIKTSVFTGVLVYDETSWGDVSTATHVTMDVKGSFAGSGGINLYVHGDGGTLWSWTASATDLAVGNNPGDITEWTTILIPINKPTMQTDNVLPALPNEEGAWADSNGDPYPGGGNWGVNGSHADDAAMIAAWDLTISTVNRIDVRGLTPDSQIDNLGFVLPDVGLPGDFDADNDVDGADFLVWQRAESPSALSASDLADWEGNFGTVAAVVRIGVVPEPSAIALALIGVSALVAARRRRTSSAS